jgi:hypothetical protein
MKQAVVGKSQEYKLASSMRQAIAGKSREYEV